MFIFKSRISYWEYIWFIVVPTFSYGQINMHQVEFMSTELSNRIKNHFEQSTTSSMLESEFNRLYRENYYEIKEKKISEISKIFAQNLYDLLESNKQSLINIKDKIEELYSKYEYNESITPFPYDNERDIPESSVVEEPSFYPRIKVNINQSNVQIPMNIYKYDKKILNAVKWSQDINKVFKLNHYKTPSLLWQYFASKDGAMRTYPGRRDPSEINFYDARRRLWYTEAINSPKDVIIALDLSGSLIGTPFKIATLTVKSLINTFQQNDFFNVIYSINQDVSYIEPCLQRLVQATNENKASINSKIDLLKEPFGEQNNTGLLTEAFLLFNKSLNNDRTSSGCTKTLMIVSDGIESESLYNDIIKKYEKYLDVVIFTFFIGFGQCKEQMTLLAEENGGKMQEFPTLGSVWNGVLEHQTVLSEPLAESPQSNNITFTPLYLDFFEDGQIGLGMIISMAIGAFSRNDTNVQLLGAAGIDIRMTQLEQQYPIDKLGIFGKAFAINNNGLFLIHPNFRDPAPLIFNLPSVYLEDVEYTVNASVAEQLKIKMLEKETGCLASEVYFIYPSISSTRLAKYNTSYCYHPIQGTPFASAVSVPNQNIYSINVLGTYFNQLGVDGLQSDNDNIHIEIASWLICDIPAQKQTNKPASKKYFPKAIELYNYLSSKPIDEIMNDPKCDASKLSNLLFVSAIVDNHTNLYWDDSKLDAFNTKMMYILTESGYTYVFAKNKIKNFSRNIFTEEAYLHPSSKMDRTATNFITVTVPVKLFDGRFVKTFNSFENVDLLFGKSIFATPENISQGVIGLSYSSIALNKLLLNVSLSFDCSKSIECFKFNCSDNENYHCYLIDDNAYIVSSNQETNDVGVFFGLVKGELLNLFVNLSIYKLNNFNDTQSICNETISNEKSHANHLTNIYTNLISSIQFILIKTIYLFIMATQFLAGEIQTDKKMIFRNTICTKNVSIYTQSVADIAYQGEIACTKSCTEIFAIKTIKDTNLNLVVIQNNCSSTCSYPIVSNKPVKIETGDICSEKDNHRKKLPVCKKKTSTSSYNSSSIGIPVCKLNLSGFMFFIMLLLWL